MSLETIEKALEKHEKKEEILADVKSTLEAEKESAKKEGFTEGQRKANSEAKNVRERFKKKWEEIGLDPDSDEFEEKFSEIKDAKSELEKLRNQSGSDKTQIAALENKIDKLTENFAKSENEKKDLKLSQRRRDVESEIRKHLTEGKAIKPDVLTKNLLLDVDFTDDSREAKDLTIKIDGKDFAIKDGVEEFLKANQEFVRNETAPGGQSGGDRGTSQMKPDEIQARREKLRSMGTSVGL